MRRLILTLTLLLIGCSASTKEIATADFGPTLTPSMAEAVIRPRLLNALRDPSSLQDFKIVSVDRATWLRTVIVPERQFGYRVVFSYNAKNAFGGYVGRQVRFAYFIDGELAHSTRSEPGHAGDGALIEMVQIIDDAKLAKARAVKP